MVRKKLAVALNDEAGQATFEIGFGLPANLVAVDSHVRWGGRRSYIGHGSVLDVVHPSSRHGFIWQPASVQWVSVKLRSRHCFNAGHIGQPNILTWHSSKRLATRAGQPST